MPSGIQCELGIRGPEETPLCLSGSHLRGSHEPRLTITGEAHDTRKDVQIIASNHRYLRFMHALFVPAAYILRHRRDFKSACHEYCMDCVLNHMSADRAPKIAFNYQKSTRNCRCYSKSQSEHIPVSTHVTDWQYCEPSNSGEIIAWPIYLIYFDSCMSRSFDMCIVCM